MKIIKADASHLSAIACLASCLWDDHSPEELLEEFSQLVETPDAALFLALDADLPVGFAQCQLRFDYVEGTESSPVGYLEGIYVMQSHRRQGVAKTLLAACEAWARSQNCREFASDCELTNTQSQFFHRALGFREANRIVCYTKPLSEGFL